ncbi:hypothetical protein ACWA1F_07085 [Flavobacterium sp. 3-218]
MKIFKPLSLLFSILLAGCVGNMNPTGGNSAPNYPFFITTEPIIVKKIQVPIGTKLVYEESFFNEGKMEHKLSEEKLKTIEFPVGKELIWGGVPVKSIDKFFNSEMHGYTVTADFNKLSDDKKTKFSELWKSCNDDLGITIRNTDDWSFNKLNIADIEDCSVNNQRYFKDDKKQQSFLNEMYAELQKVNPK